MRWSEILARLNQIGIGPVNVGWAPVEADSVRVRRIIRYLEDRRMLFNDCAQEDLRYCVISAEEIRKRLTTELEQLPDNSPLLSYFRAIRTSARMFMDRFPEATYPSFESDDRSLQQLAMSIYLGQLRSEIGLQVALMAARWQVDVENDLARVLPRFD